MVKKQSASIRSHFSFPRAPEETARLFAALELFVNLGDSFDDFCSFARRCPTFCPAQLYHENADRYLALQSNNACHQMVLVFRDYLRLVWRRDAWALGNGVVEILLGLKGKPQPDEPDEDDELIPQRIGTAQWSQDLERRSLSRSLFGDFAPRYRRALMLMRLDPESQYYRFRFSLMLADWQRGDFRYEASNDFQRAVLLLFHHSWRARICRKCQKPFIADKNPQMHCGIECSTSARKERDLKLWREQGAARRQTRKEKSKPRTK
jgi:hypothetical protein